MRRRIQGCSILQKMNVLVRGWNKYTFTLSSRYLGKLAFHDCTGTERANLSTSLSSSYHAWKVWRQSVLKWRKLRILRAACPCAWHQEPTLQMSGSGWESSRLAGRETWSPEQGPRGSRWGSAGRRVGVGCNNNSNSNNSNGKWIMIKVNSSDWQRKEGGSGEQYRGRGICAHVQDG